MAAQLPQDGAEVMTEFLLTQSLTDFEIRCPGFSFKVHRIIISSASQYFRKICTNYFKEAREGFVTLAEEPADLARMIECIYTGSFSTDVKGPTIQTILANARLTCFLEPALSLETSQTLNRPMPAVTAATLFSLAECYLIPSLMSTSLAIFLNALACPHFTLSSLLATLSHLYLVRPTISPTLRAHAVFRAQQSLPTLLTFPPFHTLMADSENFSWDFGTKYAALNSVWCAACDHVVELVECKCGFAGVCGNEFCGERDWEGLTCTECGKSGMLRGMEEREAGGENVGEVKLRDVIDGKGLVVGNGSGTWTGQKRGDAKKRKISGSKSERVMGGEAS